MIWAVYAPTTRSAGFLAGTYAGGGTGGGAEIDTEFVDHAGLELGRSRKRGNEGAIECLLRTDDEADAA
jgi:hypothetical protein